MRIALVLALAVAVGAVAGPLLAGEGGPVPERAAMAVEVRVKALEGEVAYLRAREVALTRYVAANAQRGAALERLAGQLEALGFTQKALPAESRVALVEGIRGMGVALRDDLPTPTKGEREMLAWAERVLDAAR
jgi:hypothetical protein